MTVFDKFKLTGKTAFITGGSRGLGRAIAQAYAEAGADLILVGREQNSLEQAQQELAALGSKVTVYIGDMGVPTEAESVCQRVVQAQPVDILVNNVGGRRENIAVEQQSLADWQRLMDLNLTSAFVCSKIVGGAMLGRKWGRVINIASICGQVATKNIHGRHYETAKAGLVAFTKALAVDWAPFGITVNAIAPGGFMTAPNRRWFSERPAFRAEIEGQIPMGRLGEPDELGPLALYLASPASSYMTGAMLVIDGGYTIW